MYTLTATIIVNQLSFLYTKTVLKTYIVIKTGWYK